MANLVLGEMFFYTNNTFEFPDSIAMFSYMWALTDERRDAIRHIRVGLHTTDPSHETAWSELSEHGFWFLQANANLRTLTLELRDPIIALYQIHNPPTRSDHFVGCVPGYWEITELRNLKNLTIERGERSAWQLHRVELGERQVIQYPSPEDMVEADQMLTDLGREMYEKATLTDKPTGVDFWRNKDDEVPEEKMFRPKINITTRSKRLLEDWMME
jgi:hypothetical protein